MLVPGKKLAVFSIRKTNDNGGTVWSRAGQAWVNKDGSLNVWLDVLPLEGRLHVREPGEKRDAAPRDASFEQPAAAMGGH